MANEAPLELIVSGSGTVYLAPVATAFTLLGAAPAPAWIKLGATGPKNYSEDGIKVSMPQDIAQHRVMGAIYPRKVSRTSGEVKITLTLVDARPAMVSYAINGNAPVLVMAAAGVPGSSAVPLAQNSDVKNYAMQLIFDESSLFTAGQSAYRIPRVYASGSPEVTYNKDGLAGWSFEFAGLFDETAATGQELGLYIVQSAAPI